MHNTAPKRTAGTKCDAEYLSYRTILSDFSDCYQLAKLRDVIDASRVEAVDGFCEAECSCERFCYPAVNAD